MRLLGALLIVMLALGFGSPAGSQTTSPPPADPALLALPAQMIPLLIKNDAKALRAHCAPSGTIVDEFPPYSWSGADVCASWAAAFKQFAARIKMTNIKGNVKGTPFTDVNGSRAYMVAQVRFGGLVAGKPLTEDGTWTFVCVKSAGVWKVTNLAWGTLHH